MTRKQHVDQLAQELEATIIYDAERYGMYVNVLTRELHLSSWDDVPEEEVYWVALHELGHLAIEGGEDPTPDAAEEEARAWVWALDNAAFPLDQAGESSIAWGIADRLIEGWEPGPGLERIYAELGADPDWFFNVTEPEHFAKLDGYAKPRWKSLAAYYEARVRPSRASGAAHEAVQASACTR